MDAPIQTPVAAVAPQPPQIDARAIADLCAIAGKKNLCADFITQGLTVEQVREKLLELRADAGDAMKIASKHAGLSQTVSATIKAAADQIKAGNPALTEQQAYAAAVNANPALYEQYLAANPAQSGQNGGR